MKLTLNKAAYGLPDFYDAVARKMGYNATDNLNYDCREITIAKDIQDGFYEYYTDYLSETNPSLSEREIKVSVTMLLLMSGPKVDEALKGNEVEVFDGFICNQRKGNGND